MHIFGIVRLTAAVQVFAEFADTDGDGNIDYQARVPRPPPRRRSLHAPPSPFLPAFPCCTSATLPYHARETPHLARPGPRHAIVGGLPGHVTRPATHVTRASARRSSSPPSTARRTSSAPLPTHPHPTPSKHHRRHAPPAPPLIVCSLSQPAAGIRPRARPYCSFPPPAMQSLLYPLPSPRPPASIFYGRRRRSSSSSSASPPTTHVRAAAKPAARALLRVCGSGSTPLAPPQRGRAWRIDGFDARVPLRRRRCRRRRRDARSRPGGRP